MSHRSVVPLRMAWAGCSASNAHPRGPSPILLTLNRRGGTGVVPGGQAGSRTNCHSNSLVNGGKVGYVQSVLGIAGVSGGNHHSLSTTLNCRITFRISRPGGNTSGDGL